MNGRAGDGRPWWRSGIVLVAIAEAIAGVGLILLSTVKFNLYPFDIAETQRLLAEVGVGLMAAAILTGTVEYVTQSRHNRELTSLAGLMNSRQAELVQAIEAQYKQLTEDLHQRHHVLLEELKVATLDSILREFIPPEDIITQIRRHIIQEPFIRENYEVEIRLGWTDDRRFLNKSQTIRYRVRNVSEYPRKCPIRIREDVFVDGTERKIPRFERISVSRFREPSPWVFRNVGTNAQQISPNADKSVALEFDTSDRASTVSITFDLDPRTEASVEADFFGLISAKDFYTFNVAIPTTALELTIEHPDDLYIRARPLHPQGRFDGEDQWPDKKRWSIEAGLLPFQGVLVEWWPEPTSASGKQAAEVADGTSQPAPG